MKEFPTETTAEEIKEEKVYKKVKTPAQLAFDKAQEKRVSNYLQFILVIITVAMQQSEKIMDKAKKTHKQRVEVTSYVQ